MIAILIYIMFCVLVIKIGKPFHLAGAYVVLNAIIGLVFASSFPSVLFVALVSFVFYSVIFGLMDRYSDGIFLSLLFAAAGLILPYALSFFLS